MKSTASVFRNRKRVAFAAFAASIALASGVAVGTQVSNGSSGSYADCGSANCS